MSNLDNKERAIFVLEALIELVRNDQIHARDILGKTSDEVLAMAEAEAAKAVEGANELKGGE